MCHNAVPTPHWMIYGTAWKSIDTYQNVATALLCGFRAFDLAAQPKHYREDLAGKAITDAIRAKSIDRSELWIQSKFAPIENQDPNNVPYPEDSSIEEQIHYSVNQSLSYLRTDDDDEPYLDCLLLHSPLSTAAETLAAWSAMSGYVPSKVKMLGISNVSLPQLKVVYTRAAVKPRVVQNRFCERSGFDQAVRAFCEDLDLMYQGFWILTGSPKLLKSSPVQRLAKLLQVSEQESLYVLASVGKVVVLNGTTNSQRMVADLAVTEKLRSWRLETADQDIWPSLWSSFQEITRGGVPHG